MKKYTVETKALKLMSKINVRILRNYLHCPPEKWALLRLVNPDYTKTVEETMRMNTPN